MTVVFDIGIATIFTREFLEAAVVVGSFRNIILKSEEYQDEKKRIEGLRAVWKATIFATCLAFVVCIAVTIPLAVLSRKLDDRVVEIIEGVSKIVAAIAILQLSLKLPKWLGVYVSKKKEHSVEGVPLSTIRFNVAWNIWREMAECGVFLIPYIIAGDAIQIPVSGVVGTVIGLILGFLIYLRSKTLGSKNWMAFFCAFVTGLLSVGLFVGGCHEFEEVFGETRKVYQHKGAFWSHKKFPMVFFKPFGYSSSRTVLQICTFWLWTGMTVMLHLIKIWQTRRARELSNTDSTSTPKDSQTDTTDIEAPQTTDIEAAQSKEAEVIGVVQLK